MRGRQGVSSVFERLGAALASVLLTGSRVFSALAVNKIIAVYLGPGGLALVGQFQNFTAVVFGVTSGNVSNAVISTVSAADGDAALREAVGTVMRCLAVGTGAMAVLIAVASPWLAGAVLGDAELARVFLLLCVLMVPLIVNVALLAIAAGIGRVRAFTSINIVLAILSVPACWLLVRVWGLEGALACAILVNAVGLVISIAWLRRAKPFPMSWLWSKFDKSVALRLFQMCGMTLSTIVGVPLAQLAVRNFVVGESGVDSAGQWQAALKIGEVLLMTTSLAVSLYFLPRFARCDSGLSRLVLRGATIAMAGVSVLGLAFLWGTEYALPLLFSREFLAAERLIPFQLLGDLLRSGSLVVQAAFLTRAGVVPYVSIDILYAVCMIAVAYWLVPAHGALGAVWAVGAAGGAALLLSLCWVVLQRRKPWRA